MSWQLKVGEMKEEYLPDSTIWSIINNFFQRAKTTTSYKYIFLKSLMENLYGVDQTLKLNFDQIYYSFTKIYWNLVVHHNLNQSNSQNQRSEIQQILKGFQFRYSIPENWVFDKLTDQQQQEIIFQVKRVGKKYVVGAFYGDTNETFYSFDIKKEELRFNPAVYTFMQKYRKILTQLTNYELAKFLEKYNEIPYTNFLLGKVESISKRISLEYFYNLLIKYEEHACFYCGKTLNKRNRGTHVDHVIPWSYMQSDNLWNLVLACSKCNLSKSDKIPNEPFFEKIIERNQLFFVNLQGEDQKHISNYTRDKFMTIYKYSVFNGFDHVWPTSNTKH